MPIRVMLLSIAFASALALSGAHASHCTTWTTSETSLDAEMVVVPIPIGQTTMYFFVDLCQPDCIFSNWFYEESNGLAGLQRGDYLVDNTCHGTIEADTYVF